MTTMPGALAERTLPDGTLLVVYPLFFGTARLTLSRPGPMQTECWDNAWDYDDPRQAVRVMQEWDGVGEPDGWMRNPTTGRRRPNGDKSLEYVRE